MIRLTSGSAQDGEQSVALVSSKNPDSEGPGTSWRAEIFEKQVPLALQISLIMASWFACFYSNRGGRADNPFSPRESPVITLSCPWKDQALGLPSRFLASSRAPFEGTSLIGICKDRLCSACYKSYCLVSSYALVAWVLAHNPQSVELFPLSVWSIFYSRKFCLFGCHPRQ